MHLEWVKYCRYYKLQSMGSFRDRTDILPRILFSFYLQSRKIPEVYLTDKGSEV